MLAKYNSVDWRMRNWVVGLFSALSPELCLCPVAARRMTANHHLPSLGLVPSRLGGALLRPPAPSRLPSPVRAAGMRYRHAGAQER